MDDTIVVAVVVDVVLIDLKSCVHATYSDRPCFYSIPSDDRIRRINGEDVTDSPRDRVIEAIGACDESILLTVCQPVNLKCVVNGGGGGGGTGGSPSNQSTTNVTPNGTGTNQKSSFMTEVR